MVTFQNGLNCGNWWCFGPCFLGEQREQTVNQNAGMSTPNCCGCDSGKLWMALQIGDWKGLPFGILK